MQQAIRSRFNRASTAAEVAAGVDLRGKLVVVTGGSVGLGKETARILSNAGADVFLGARSEAQLQVTQRELGVDGRRVFSHALDLMDPLSVNSFATAVLDLGRPVDILLNNAGIMACPLMRNALGIEAQLATAYVGHAQLTSLLASALISARGARVVTLSSIAHHFSPVVLEDLNFNHRPYDKWLAYGQAKTADALLSVRVAEALGAKGVTALTVHPGVIQTDLLRFLTPEDMEESQRRYASSADQAASFKSVAAGAATSIWAVTSPDLEGEGPLYLEDCSVAPLVDEPNFSHGVLPHALDKDAAQQLWAAAETMLDQALPL